MATVNCESSPLFTQVDNAEGHDKQVAGYRGVRLVGPLLILGVFLVFWCSRFGLGQEFHKTKSEALKSAISLASRAKCPTGTLSWAHPQDSQLGTVSWTSNAEIGSAASQTALTFPNRNAQVTISWQNPVTELVVPYSDADFDERITFSTGKSTSTFEATLVGPTDSWTAPNILSGTGNDLNSDPKDFSNIKISDPNGFTSFTMDMGWIAPMGTNAVLDMPFCVSDVNQKPPEPGECPTIFSWAEPNKVSPELGKVTWSSNANVGSAASQPALTFSNRNAKVTISWEKPVKEIVIPYSDADFNERITFSTEKSNSTFEATLLGPTDSWTAPNTLSGTGNDLNSDPKDFSNIKISDPSGFTSVTMDMGYMFLMGVNAVLDISSCAKKSEKQPPTTSQRPTVAPESKSTTSTPKCNSKIPPLDLSNLVHQNLGGFGPDSGAKNLRYAGVTTLNGEEVDLVVSTMDNGYEPMSGDKSGLSGSFGKINIQPDHSANLQFQFVKKGTNIRVYLDKFAFTFYDIDGTTGTERIEVCGAQLLLEEHSELKSTKRDDCAAVTSGSDGAGVDNPRNPASLTAAQGKVSATYTFENRDSFEISLTTFSKRGRNFFFSGIPILDC